MESYDAREGQIVITSMLRLSWHDEFLTWNASEFGGLEYLSVPRTAPWLPDIALLKGAMNDDIVLGHSDLLPVFVWHTGHVVIYPAGDVRSTCIVDVFLYPFDAHVCEFQYTSAKYPIVELTITFPEPGIILGFFSENPEWMVENKDPHYILRVDPRSNIGTRVAVKRLTLRRRPAFDLVHSYVPSLVLTVLNIAASFVPFDGGERLTFSITVLLSFMFFCTSVVADFPRNGLTITLTSYMVVSMNVINVLIVIWSIVLIKISKRSTIDHPVSRFWLRVIPIVQGNKRPCKIKAGAKVESSMESNVNEHDAVFVPVKEDKHKPEDPVEADVLSNEWKAAAGLSWHDVALCLDAIFFLALITAFISLCMVWIGVLASNGAL